MPINTDFKGKDISENEFYLLDHKIMGIVFNVHFVESYSLDQFQ